MSEPLLDPRWRDRVREIGKRAFEDEEMARLGFITDATLARIEHAAGDRERYRAVRAELAEVRRELRAVDAELAVLQSVEALIAQVRARRIERVRQQRAQRQAERAEREQAAREQWLERKRITPPFLGVGVSNRLVFVGGDPAAVARRALPALEEFTDLAGALGLEPEQLQWLAYERAATSSDHYSRFEIPKRSGGTRLISSPKPAMRAAQQWIRQHVLVGLDVHSAAMAFRPGISIVDNARAHLGAEIVVRMDLADFFPSITFRRVRGLFEWLGYNPGIATVLALLCTDAPRRSVTVDGVTRHVTMGKRSLPQGACTSPDLANALAVMLDRRLAGLAQARGWRYTRYADDLVFSTADKAELVHRFVYEVARICVDEGFVVNTGKTRIMRSPNRQLVTGLLIDGDVRLTRKDLRRIRAFLHRCRTLGHEAVSQEIGKDARAVASGYLAYLHMVMPATAARMRRDNPWV